VGAPEVGNWSMSERDAISVWPKWRGYCLFLKSILQSVLILFV
jgi:hypothetical protein